MGSIKGSHCGAAIKSKEREERRREKREKRSFL
jgi:hypothetical protein